MAETSAEYRALEEERDKAIQERDDALSQVETIRDDVQARLLRIEEVLEQYLDKNDPSHDRAVAADILSLSKAVETLAKGTGVQLK